MGEDEGGMIWEKSIETCILSSVKQIASPGWMHETSARGWCIGMTQRDGMRRGLEGDSRWGTQVNPGLIHVNVRKKTLQYCKITTIISLQLIKNKKIKFIWNNKGPWIATVVPKKEQGWRNRTLWFQTILQSYNNQNSIRTATQTNVKE